MERYESYKDSGVKWIGEIPAHWEVLSLKFIHSPMLRNLPNPFHSAVLISLISFHTSILPK